MKNILIAILATCLLSACVDEQEVKAKEAEAEKAAAVKEKQIAEAKQEADRKLHQKYVIEPSFDRVQAQLKGKNRIYDFDLTTVELKTRVDTIRRMMNNKIYQGANKDVANAIAFVIGYELYHRFHMATKSKAEIRELPELFADILFAAASEKDFDQKYSDKNFRKDLNNVFGHLKDEAAKFVSVANFEQDLMAALKKALPKVSTLKGDDVPKVVAFFKE